MLESLFIILLIFAILLLTLSLEHEKNPFWNLVAITTDAALWFILALGVIEIELPYQIYNSSSGNVEEGVHIFTSIYSIYISYVFMLFGVIMFIYLVVMIFDKYTSWVKGKF